MSLLEVLPLVVALAMDAFAVSVGAGATFRLAFHFGLFQFLMPVIGWQVGSTVARHFEVVDHWIALRLVLGERRPTDMVPGGTPGPGT